MSRIHWKAASAATPHPAAMISTGEPAAFGPVNGGFAVSGAWAEIYRLAYERAVAATAPSRFQRMLEPRWN